MKTQRMWTRQVADVLKELEQTGRYLCKEQYIREKNGSMADYYLRLYEWYTRHAARYMKIPEDAGYPIWLSMDEETMLQPVEGTVILEAEIPKEQFLLCNMDAWGYRVNYWYVPLDEQDEKRHLRELKRFGVTNEEELIMTDKGNFYPLLKREIEASWERVFTVMPKNPKDSVATAWELRKEWIREVRYFE